MPFRTTPPLPRLRRIVILTLAAGALTLVLGYALLPQMGAARSLLSLLTPARLWFLGAALLCQAGVYVCVALILWCGLSAASDVPNASTLLWAGGAFLWANRALPGPAVAGLATLMFILGRDQQKPVSAAAAQAAAAVFYVADYAGFIVLGMAALPVVFFLPRRGNDSVTALPVTPAILAAGLILAGAMGVLWLLRSPAVVRRATARTVRRGAILLRRPEPDQLGLSATEAVDQFFLRWQAVTTRPGALVAAGFAALLMHLLEAATLASLVGAFSGVTHGTAQGRTLLGAAAGYVAGNLAAIVSFLPAGLGFFEGAMGTVLHLLGGVPVPVAAAATVAYRICSVWLLLPVVLGTARQAVAAMDKATGPKPTEKAESCE